MKWIKNSIVGLTLLACFFPDARAVTQEDLSTVFLRLYTGSSMEKYIDAHLKEAETLTLDIDNKKPTVIYLHGYTESVNSTSVQTVVNAYLNRSDHNVMALDWSVIADMNYLQVAGNGDSVGAVFAMALNDMVHAGLSAEKLHIVGHSMGAQVAGEAGRKVNFTVPRITGLDPAGPLFNIIEPRLSHTDARFVDIIHTDYGFYGIGRITGSVDFLPNGGRRIQPGCPLIFSLFSQEEFCSHHRSWVFYAESLGKERSFLAVPCPQRNRILATKQVSSDPIVMGYATPTDAKGTYCLVTGASKPYGRGAEGAHRVKRSQNIATSGAMSNGSTLPQPGNTQMK